MAQSSELPHRDDAVHYHNDAHGSRVLVDIITRHLRGDVLELGAGVGHISRELALRVPSVTSLEPVVEIASQLRANCAKYSNIQVVENTLSGFFAATQGLRQFDTAVLINVLEHLEDDAGELALVCRLLKPKGRLIIIVPAHQWLYSKVDRLTGHFRRYSKTSLSQAVRASGFEITSLHNFETVGLLPYLLIYRLARSTSVDGRFGEVFSRVVLPLSALLYRVTRGHLIGKNLICVATPISQAS
jgi:2-polyprenyl-3-methyl-5-hydroxy-6-metoxy-1,4-benzoquinol methylase